MKLTIQSIFCLITVSLLLGCNNDGSAAEDGKTASSANVVVNESARSTTSDGRYFTKDITTQACDLLTPDILANVVGVDSSMLKQRNTGGMCLYTWEGGRASLGFLRTRDTIEFARSSFENSYRDQSEKELEQTMARIDTEVEKNRVDGASDVDPAQAKMITGTMRELVSGGLKFENIEGLGDAASFELGRSESQIGGKTYISYANSLNVLLGNLKFTVSFNRDGEPQLYRDENVALARAVLGKLSD